jgi:hypothetical protein
MTSSQCYKTFFVIIDAWPEQVGVNVIGNPYHQCNNINAINTKKSCSEAVFLVMCDPSINEL